MHWLKQLQALETNHFKIRNFSHDKLTIASSFDFGYYEQYEIVFSGVTYINLPTAFGSCYIRQREPNTSLLRYSAEEPCQFLEFEIDELLFYIGFQSIEIFDVQQKK